MQAPPWLAVALAKAARAAERALAFTNLCFSPSTLNYQPISFLLSNDGDHFQQILAWTLKSRWQKQNQMLRQITGSFRSEK